MGAKNVAACFAMWSHLDHAPFRLLCGMALVALDEDASGRATRRFFGGQDALTELLGRTRRSAFRALATLKEQGAIEVQEEGRNGHRAIYRLNLDPMARVTLTDTLQEAAQGDAHRHPAPVDKDTQGDAHRHPEGCRSAPTKGDAQRPRRVTLSDTPRNNGGTTEESRGGEHHRPAPQDRARGSLAAHPDEISPATATDTPAAAGPPPRRLAAVPDPDNELDYQTAYRELTAALGFEPATTAAMAYAEANDCTVAHAVVCLVRDRRRTA